MPTTSTTQDLRKLLSRTAPIRELLAFAQQHPVDLFLRIAREYERTGQPLADHQMGPIHYVSDVALRALTEAGLIQQPAQGRYFIRAFVPTKKGMDYFQRIQSEGAVEHDRREAVARGVRKAPRPAAARPAVRPAPAAPGTGPATG